MKFDVNMWGIFLLLISIGSRVVKFDVNMWGIFVVSMVSFMFGVWKLVCFVLDFF